MKILKYIALILSIFMLSCTEKRFNKEEWSAKGDAGFPPEQRTEMLNDLLANNKFTGLTYDEIVKKIGDPDLHDSSSFIYNIEIDYGRDIDPIYTKRLFFYMSIDSLVTYHEVKEWSKKE